MLGLTLAINTPITGGRSKKTTGEPTYEECESAVRQKFFSHSYRYVYRPQLVKRLKLSLLRWPHVEEQKRPPDSTYEQDDGAEESCVYHVVFIFQGD